MVPSTFGGVLVSLALSSGPDATTVPTAITKSKDENVLPMCLEQVRKEADSERPDGLNAQAILRCWRIGIAIDEIVFRPCEAGLPVAKVGIATPVENDRTC